MNKTVIVDWTYEIMKTKIPWENHGNVNQNKKTMTLKRLLQKDDWEHNI